MGLAGCEECVHFKIYHNTSGREYINMLLYRQTWRHFLLNSLEFRMVICGIVLWLPLNSTGVHNSFCFLKHFKQTWIGFFPSQDDEGNFGAGGVGGWGLKNVEDISNRFLKLRAVWWNAKKMFRVNSEIVMNLWMFAGREGEWGKKWNYAMFLIRITVRTLVLFCTAFPI